MASCNAAGNWPPGLELRRYWTMRTLDEVREARVFPPKALLLSWAAPITNCFGVGENV